MDRRTMLGVGAAFLASGCGSPFSIPEGGAGSPRLTARPGTPAQTLAPGKTTLGPASGWVYMPQSAASSRPLLLLLHGAGADSSAFDFMIPLLEEHGVIALAPDSRYTTWDKVNGPFGEDVEFIDGALRFVFTRAVVDPARIGIAGFSDGASYALSLGLPNGTLFTDVFAWSPGFMQVPYREGRPAVFVSHGTNDDVLPIEQASRKLVPRLRDWGYDVRYEEFAGGHTVPDAILRLSLELLVA